MEARHMMYKLSKLVKGLLRIQQFIFFQNGGHPLSSMCGAQFWTMYEEHMVFIVVQNLVKIAAVEYFAHLARKCLFTSPKLGFIVRFNPQNWVQYQHGPQNAHCYMERCHMMHRLWKISQTVSQIQQFYISFKMVAICHLGFVECIFGQPTKNYLIFITVKNLVLIDEVVLIYSIKVWIICTFCLKTPIHAPKEGLWEYMMNKIGCDVNVTPKRHICMETHYIQI